ncbi:uncharacterized protein AFUA_7G02410 [Aspergillus fumigatus Af293]
MTPCAPTSTNTDHRHIGDRDIIHKDRHVVSQLALRLIVNDLHHYFTPGFSASESLQGSGHTLQSHKSFVCEGCPSELALGHQIEDSLPDNAYRLLLKLGVLAPVQADKTDVLQQHPVQRDFLDFPGRKPNHQQPRIPGHALETGIDHTNRIIHDVHARLPIPCAVLRTQLFYLLRPLLIAVINHIVRSKLLRDLSLALCPRSRNHRRPLSLGNLHSRQPNSTRRRMHKDPVTRLHIGPMHQTAV